MSWPLFIFKLDAISIYAKAGIHPFGR